MTEWLLLITLMSHGRIDQLVVSRFPTEQACESQGVKETKGKRTTAFVCFEVAKLPTSKRLNPVGQPKR